MWLTCHVKSHIFLLFLFPFDRLLRQGRGIRQPTSASALLPPGHLCRPGLLGSSPSDAVIGARTVSDDRGSSNTCRNFPSSNFSVMPAKRCWGRDAVHFWRKNPPYFSCFLLKRSFFWKPGAKEVIALTPKLYMRMEWTSHKPQEAGSECIRQHCAVKRQRRNVGAKQITVKHSVNAFNGLLTAPKSTGTATVLSPVNRAPQCFLQKCPNATSRRRFSRSGANESPATVGQSDLRKRIKRWAHPTPRLFMRASYHINGPFSRTIFSPARFAASLCRPPPAVRQRSLSRPLPFEPHDLHFFIHASIATALWTMNCLHSELLCTVMHRMPSQIRFPML